MAKYANLEYWERRYEMDTDVFEWYGKYERFSSLIKEYIEPENSILNIGCGTARFSADLYDDGFTDLTNIDFSPSAIEINENRFKEKKNMEWMEMDMCEMPDSWSKRYDAVVDKGGSDTVFVGDDTPDDVTRALTEVSRVLKPDGVFLLISCCVPNNRLRYLIPEEKETNPYDWTVFERKIAKASDQGIKIDPNDPRCFIYVYICVKGQRGRDMKRQIKVDIEKAEKEKEEQAARDEADKLMAMVSGGKKKKKGGKAAKEAKEKEAAAAAAANANVNADANADDSTAKEAAAPAEEEHKDGHEGPDGEEHEEHSDDHDDHDHTDDDHDHSDED